MNEHSLAVYGNRVARPPEDPRRRLIRRTVSTVAVVLVHVCLFTVFILSEVMPPDVQRRSPIETFLLLSMMAREDAPKVTIIQPEIPHARAPYFITSPVDPVMAEPPMISPPTEDDILRAIGNALACGANSFEYLTQTQRNRCHREPWIAQKMPNGNIVMEGPPRAMAEQPQIRLSGPEQLRRDMQTAPGCPILLQVPCVSDVLSGRNNRPF